MATNVCAMMGNGSVVEGTASASDVVSGKTFMSATSDDLQTGTRATTKTITISYQYTWGSGQGYNKLVLSGPFGTREFDCGYPTGQSHSGWSSFSFTVDV